MLIMQIRTIIIEEEKKVLVVIRFHFDFYEQ